MGKGPRLGLLGLGGYGIVMSALGVASLLGGMGVVLPGGPRPLQPAQAAAPVSAPAALPSSPPGGGPIDLNPDRVAGLPERPAEDERPLAIRRRSFVPRAVRLPNGDLARVRAAGVHPDGSLAVPDRPTVLGWWTGGALVGDPFGTVVIAGHVDSRRFGLGTLAALHKARKGQVIEVRASTRKRERYRIASITQVPQARLARGTDAFRQDGPHRLVMITCGGKYDPVAHRYEDNLVVVAVPTD